MIYRIGITDEVAVEEVEEGTMIVVIDICIKTKGSRKMQEVRNSVRRQILATMEIKETGLDNISNEKLYRTELRW